MERKQLTWKARGELWLRLGIRLALAALAVWLTARFGPGLLSLFAPFVAAFAAAALLNPLVKRLQRGLGWSRQVLTLLLLLLILGALGTAAGVLIWAAGQELVSLLQDWNALLEGLQEVLGRLDALLSRFSSVMPPELVAAWETAGARFIAWLGEAVPVALGTLAALAGQKAMGLPSLLVALVIFVMAAYFLTADYPYLRGRAAQSLDDGLRRFVSQVRATALGAFGGYLRAELLLSAGVFFILLGGFLLTRQPYGLLLALGLAVFDFIPIVGAGTVMVPWAVIAFITQDYPAAIRLMVIWGLIALFRRVMEPKFVGSQTGLSPILSLVSIYAGMKLGGVLGMIFGPILLLVALNLAGMGMFHGLRLDVEAAARDIAAILSQRPDGMV